MHRIFSFYGNSGKECKYMNNSNLTLNELRLDDDPFPEKLDTLLAYE